MVNKTGKDFLSIALFITVFLTTIIFVGNFAIADSGSRFLKYLPHDEVVDSVSKKYSPALAKRGISCAAAFEDATRCFYCVQTLKSVCPDCCLSFKTPKNAIRCTKEDNSRFDCPDLAYQANTCPAVAACRCPSTVEECTAKINDCSDCPVTKTGTWTCDDLPHCQRQGCPSIKPKASSGNKCILKEGKWVCEEKDLLPGSTGCSTKTINGCRVSKYYDVSPILDCQGLSSPAPSECYEYIPTAKYQTCIENCQAHTDKWEQCTKSVNCCNKSVCGSGFGVNCDATRCQERIDWSECDTFTLPGCIDLQQQAIDCISNPRPGSTCSRCFEEIDPNLSYKFVARSREAMVIFWQIFAETEFSGVVSAQDIPTYFFTMVKVIDRKGNEVHRSIIHQKSFQGSFSIFSATALDASSLQQGETYTVRLYYFLSDKLLIPGLENLKLAAKVKSAELIVTRTRN